jgi:hypothetical protein
MEKTIEKRKRRVGEKIRQKRERENIEREDRKRRQRSTQAL